MASVTEIVLTGGPAAGKSTALAHLRQALEARGIGCLVVPEIPTTLAANGLGDFAALAREAGHVYAVVEEQTLLMQLELADRYRTIAEALTCERAVVIHDRATMDVAFYLGADPFWEICRRHTLTLAEVRDRFAAVVHLRSSAHVEGAYSTENNPARFEDTIGALRADDGVLRAWMGHPKLHLVPALADLPAKLDRTLACVLEVLGIPVPIERERKFLVESFDASARARAHAIAIEQVYLHEPGPGELRVRKRAEGDYACHLLTRKHDLPDGTRAEIEVPICAEEYTRRVAEQQRAGTRTITKTRHLLPVHDALWEIDVFSSPEGVQLAEVELLDGQQLPPAPDGVRLGAEVTDDRRWRNAAMAAL